MAHKRPRKPSGGSVPAAQRCKVPGCDRRKLGQSEVCSEHLTERLRRQRAERERRREEGAGHWSAWVRKPSPEELTGSAPSTEPADPPGPTPSDERPRQEPTPKEPPQTTAPQPDLGALKAEIRRKVRRAEAEQDKAPLFGLLQPGALLDSLEGATKWLPPDLESLAWKAAQAAEEKGLLDPSLSPLQRAVDSARAGLDEVRARTGAGSGSHGAEPIGESERAEPSPTPAAAEPETRVNETAPPGSAPTEQLLEQARDTARRATGAVAETARAASETVLRMSPEIAASAGHLAGALVDSARAGLRAVEEGVGAVAEPLLGAGLSEAARLGRRATRGKFGSLGAGIDMAERVVDAAGKFRGGRKWIARRLSGEYVTDPYGLDEDVLRAAQGAMRALYRNYFRVETAHLDRLPDSGPALIVANKGGLLPIEGAMLQTAILQQRNWLGRQGRLLRVLVPHWITGRAGLASLLPKLGMVTEHPQNAERLLREGFLVLAFPEGAPAYTRPYNKRGEVLPFTETDLFLAARRAGAAVFPCGIEGAARTQPTFARSRWLGRVVGLPHLPVTPTFPLLGPLGLLPLPTRLHMTIGDPLASPGPADRAASRATARLARDAVQALLDARLGVSGG